MERDIIKMSIKIIDLGIIDYKEAWNLQLELIEKRYRKNISDVLILAQHPDVITLGRRGKIEEIKASAEESDRLNKKVYTMMARNCGKKDDYFLKIVDKKKHADWFIDSDEAKKHNLANQIRIPKINYPIINYKLILIYSR